MDFMRFPYLCHASPIRLPLVTHGPMDPCPVSGPSHDLPGTSLVQPRRAARWRTHGMDSLDFLAEADSAEKKYHNLMTYIYIDCLYDLNDLNDLKSTFLVAKPHVYRCLLAKSLKHAG